MGALTDTNTPGRSENNVSEVVLHIPQSLGTGALLSVWFSVIARTPVGGEVSYVSA